MIAHTQFKKNGVIEDLYFIHPTEVLTNELYTLEQALNKAEQHQQAGKYAIVAVTYEALKQHQNELSFIIGLFETPVDRKTFLQHYNGSGIYLLEEFQHTETKENFMSSVEKIREYIRDGHTYQVNFTTRLTSKFSGDTHELYETLTQNHNGDYTAYIQHNQHQIISCSPELFFEVENNTIRTRPMKGTMKRYSNKEKDTESYHALKHSLKDRAENVMIVDLLRNDLSKVAQKSSVRVPHLFTIEAYKTVYQMTSTIQATLKSQTSLNQIFEALFPCGSITGAPKISTMNIIEELEATPRGFYCGAIGILYNDLNMVFNVPIRTLHIKEGFVNYGAGGGITYDSEPLLEYEEMVAKTAFLNQAKIGLIESMKVVNHNLLRLEYHARRLKESIQTFQYPPIDFVNIVTEYIKHIPQGEFKLRFETFQNGEYHITHEAIKEISEIKALLTSRPIMSHPLFLEHKTSKRNHYFTENDEFSHHLYYNKNQCLTEFSIGNFVVKENDGYFTPSLRQGLLNGVMRQSLIDAKLIQEKDYHLNDFIALYERGEIEVYLINSVREWLKVDLTISR